MDHAVDGMPATTRRTRSDLFGHPRGMAFLAGTELWERVSFHGMLALLVLYMADRLLLPAQVGGIIGFAGFRALVEGVTGPLSTQALATQIFGLYIGLVYFTPVFGGLLGDRVIGRRGAVTLGAVLMTAGHFCMAFDSTFLIALLLLILGAGFLRGNLLAQLGQLYAPDDPRRDEGFQIYYSMVNFGGFVSPIITGALAQRFGWHVGFGFAGIGMLVGLVVYLAGSKHLPPETRHRSAAPAAPLSPHEWRVVLTLLALVPAVTLFWVAQAQVWDTYNLWARDHVDLVVLGMTVPVPWLQSADALGAVAMVPPVVLFWRWRASRGAAPDEIGKLGRGCLMFGAAMVWLACGHLVAGPGGKVPLAWDLMFHLLSAFGYLYVQPVAIALFARAAPPSVSAMMVGVYFLSIFVGSTVSGRLGGLYETMAPMDFWLLHAAIVAAGGLIILVFASPLRRTLLKSPPP